MIDIHSGLSGLVVEKTKIKINGKTEEFDGMWASSLTNTAAKGKPDIEAVDLTERLQLINEVLEVTTKPILYDADTGSLSAYKDGVFQTTKQDCGMNMFFFDCNQGLNQLKDFQAQNTRLALII